MSKSMHHSFDIHLAEEYGLESALMIHHFQHWIQINIRKKTNEHDGRTWTYQTLKDIAAHFPYWSENQVQEIIERLCLGKNRRSKKKERDFEPVIMKGNFNKTNYDRTVWYAFVNQEKFTILANANMEIGKCLNGFRHMPTPIPDTKTDTIPDKDIVLTVPSPKKADRKGKSFVHSLSKEQLKLHDTLIRYEPQWGPRLESADVCAWFLSNKWSVEQVKIGFDVYKQDAHKAHLEGRSVDSMGGAMVTAIKDKRGLENRDMGLNRDYAIRLAKIHKFLEVTKKYVKISSGLVEGEIYFDHSKLEFTEMLDNWVSKARLEVE